MSSTVVVTTEQGVCTLRLNRPEKKNSLTREMYDSLAEAIRAAFLAGGEFAAERIAVTAPTEVEPEGEDWVLMELGLAADHSP